MSKLLSRAFKRILLIFIALIVVVVVVIALQWSRLTSLVEKQIEKIALEQGLPLELKNLQIGLSGISAEQVQARFDLRNFYILSEAGPVHLDFSLIKLLSNRIDASLKAIAYAGEIAGRVSLDLRKELLKIPELKINQIRLEKHPQLMGLGLIGIFSVNLRNLDIDRQRLMNGQINWNVEQARLSRATKWPIPIDLGSGAVMSYDLELPVITDIQSSLNASAKNEILEISALKFDSSLGKLQCQGRYSLRQQRESLLTCIVELLPAGQAVFSDELTLISQGRITKETNRFQVDYRGGKVYFMPQA